MAETIQVAMPSTARIALPATLEKQTRWLAAVLVVAGFEDGQQQLLKNAIYL